MSCQKEQEVLEAAQTGRLESEWGEPLRAHLAECPSCADLVLVARFLQEESDSESPIAEIKVPSAALVWWKAQLRTRREAAQQALKPVRIAERVALACALLGALASLVWFGDMAGLTVSGLFSFESGLVVSTGAALLCLMAFALYTALARK